jgi:hypothetical protein
MATEKIHSAVGLADLADADIMHGLTSVRSAAFLVSRCYYAQMMTDIPYSQKPRFGEPCNGCGYCCTMQPCALAEEFLKCTTGPCVALERDGDRTGCGLVRNPLGYLFKAAHPQADVPVLDAPLATQAGSELSADMARALGIGLGCDSDDDADSEAWPALRTA